MLRHWNGGLATAPCERILVILVHVFIMIAKPFKFSCHIRPRRRTVLSCSACITPEARPARDGLLRVRVNQSESAQNERLSESSVLPSDFDQPY